MTQTSPALERFYSPKLMFMIVNPIMSFLLGTGAGKHFSELARLEFRGQKTGKENAVVEDHVQAQAKAGGLQERLRLATLTNGLAHARTEIEWARNLLSAPELAEE